MGVRLTELSPDQDVAWLEDQAKLATHSTVKSQYVVKQGIIRALEIQPFIPD